MYVPQQSSCEDILSLAPEVWTVGSASRVHPFIAGPLYPDHP